jgi:signal transduction histidine kinase
VRRRRDHLGRDVVRTAALAAAVVLVLLVALCVGVDLLVRHNLVAAVDERLQQRITALQRERDLLRDGGVRDEEDRNLEAPVLYWVVDRGGNVLSHSAGAPNLPSSLRAATGPRDAGVGGVDVRLSGAPVADERLVAAESLAPVSRALTSMLVAEGLFAPVLLGAVFLGAVAIGYRVAGPVELARRRHVAFTADASHELRTPLAVIEAETTLALGARRDAEGYREALERVSGESRRLRRIVDDLLWLARFDSEPEAPRAEPVDLAQVAADAVDRFRTVAASRGLRLRSEVRGDRPPVIDAPADWVDRLCGVLLDNACKYSPAGGEVEVVVRSEQGGVSLTVRDHGPGIPAEQRQRIFDRFHRATDSTPGAGLGLAIADAVVRGSGGRWEVGETPGGGATLTVAWPRSAGVGFQRLQEEGLPGTGRHGTAGVGE